MCVLNVWDQTESAGGHHLHRRTRLRLDRLVRLDFGKVKGRIDIETERDREAGQGHCQD